MYQLSYKWSINSLKYFAVVISLLTGLFIFAFLLYFVQKNPLFSIDTILLIFFGGVYSLFSLAYSYFLSKSITVFYDSEYIYIGDKPVDTIKIPLSNITKIKRTIFYFYSISIHRNMRANKIHIFISMNPTITKPDSIKHLLQLVKHEKNN